MEHKDYAMDFERIFTFAFDCYRSTRNGANMETYKILERMIKDLSDNPKLVSPYKLGVRMGIVSTYLTVAIDKMALMPEYQTNTRFRDKIMKAKRDIADDPSIDNINKCIDNAMAAIRSIAGN